MVNAGLRYFATVARRGSIREAADELHVAQSALSRQILKLEAHFGVPLFERHARGVKLTSAGEIFLRYARSNLQQIERVSSELDALKGLRRGTVKIQSIESLVQNLLPAAIARFRERHPGVTFEVTIDTTDHVIAAVREGRADIGLAFYPPVDSELTTAFKVSEPLVAVMSADHPLAKRDRVSLADSMSYPIALPMRHSGARMLIDIACKAAGIQLTPSLETNSIQLRVRFVYASLGITFLTRLTVLDSVRSGDLVAVSLKDRIVNSASIDAVTLSTRHLPVAAEEFVHLLQRELESLKESPRKQPRGSRQ